MADYSEAVNAEPLSRLREQIGASWMSQAISVAAELQLADLLAEGPRSARQLAAAANCDEPSLQRLLHALTSLAIFREDAEGRFALAPGGEYLRSDAPQSLRNWAIWCGRFHWPVWANLLGSVRAGKSARTLAGADAGASGYAHIECDPRAAAVFNRAMVEISTLIAGELATIHDWDVGQHVVDVGGGYGGVLAALLSAHPTMRGTLFDLPHAMGGAAARLAEAGVIARCALVTGSFFESIPEGGDVYLLKSILHNWDDNQCRAILANCRRSMLPDARLLLVERVMPTQLGTTSRDRAIARSDLNMLVGLSGRERSAMELDRLLRSTGFEILNGQILMGEFSLIEAVPTRG